MNRQYCTCYPWDGVHATNCPEGPAALAIHAPDRDTVLRLQREKIQQLEVALADTKLSTMRDFSLEHHRREAVEADRSRLLAGLQQLTDKWAARADHGFDPEEAWETTSYWRGVSHVLRELATLIGEAAPR